MNLEALIFDYDGLIIDTEGPGFVSWLEIYQDFDRKLTLDDWRHATGYVSGFDPAWHLEKLLGRKLDWTDLTMRRESRNWELTLQQGTLPGIRELFGAAAANGLKIGVASNSGGNWVPDGLVRLGLREYVGAVVTRDMVINPKPAPDVYLKAAQTLGVDPARTVGLEDSEPGSRAAKAAGMKVVVVPNRFSELQDLSCADLKVTSATELSLERLDALIS